MYYRYELILVARDQGTPKRSESIRFLTILLVDVSENKPEFPDASNPYKFYVYENSYRDIRVGMYCMELKMKMKRTHILLSIQFFCYHWFIVSFIKAKFGYENGKLN